MSRGGLEDVAVIVAATPACPPDSGRLGRFVEEVGGRGEVVLVDGSGGDRDESAGRGVRRLARPTGRLVPEHWRDGLEATHAPLIVFTTAALAPRPGWLSALRRRADEDRRVAVVGGAIAPADGLSAIGRAVFLHRFVRYLPARSGGEIPDPPGDHSLYRRERLRGLERLWLAGFWEAEILPALRRRGDAIARSPEAVLEFHGGSDWMSLLPERWAHARRYGNGRAGRGGRIERTLGAPADSAIRDPQSAFGRVTRTLAAPAVPAVLLARIGRALREADEPIRPWLPALPCLLALLGTWTVGEVAGAWLGPSGMALPESDAGDMMRPPAAEMAASGRRARPGERAA